MSRHIRRMLGSASGPASIAINDEEYEPPYIYNQSKNSFAELKVSSGESEAEHEFPIDSSDTEEVKNKGLIKKKKLRKSKKFQETSYDDIDRSIREVNALFGEPSEPPPPPVDQTDKLFLKIFAPRQKYLDYTNEYDMKFGLSRTGYTKRCSDKSPVNKNNPFFKRQYSFKRQGLSMSVERTEKDHTYFVFDHNRKYQQLQHNFIREISTRNPMYSQIALASRRNMHVEGMLQLFEIACHMEEFEKATEILEELISYMCHCAHHNFNIGSVRTRLEFRYVENRVFLVALLKLVYLVSNKACHRTALEITKVLLNLDPTDPLAVLYVMDVLALRAGEYEWLIDAVDYLNGKRRMSAMFNIDYSYAMALFQVAFKNKADLGKADKHLKQAILNFPWFVTSLLASLSRVPPKAIKDCHIFKGYAYKATDEKLKQLIDLYVAMVGHLWNKVPAMTWLLRNAEELGTRYYRRDRSVRTEIKFAKMMLEDVYHGWSVQAYRHLSCIYYLSTMLTFRVALLPILMYLVYKVLLFKCQGEDRKLLTRRSASRPLRSRSRSRSKSRPRNSKRAGRGRKPQRCPHCDCDN